MLFIFNRILTLLKNLGRSFVLFWLNCSNVDAKDWKVQMRGREGAPREALERPGGAGPRREAGRLPSEQEEEKRVRIGVRVCLAFPFRWLLLAFFFFFF